MSKTHTFSNFESTEYGVSETTFQQKLTFKILQKYVLSQSYHFGTNS